MKLAAVLALFLIIPGLALAQSQPAEAKLEKTPAELKFSPGESPCGDYLIFHDGAVNRSEVDKLSYFYIAGASRYAMPAIKNVEVVVTDQTIPTVQQFAEGGKLVRVVLRLSRSERDKAGCLDKAKAGKLPPAATGF